MYENYSLAELGQISKASLRPILPIKAHVAHGGGLHEFGYKPGIVGRAVGMKPAKITQRVAPNRTYDSAEHSLSGYRNPVTVRGTTDLTPGEIINGKRRVMGVSGRAAEEAKDAKYAARQQAKDDRFAARDAKRNRSRMDRIGKALLPKYTLEPLAGGSHRFVRKPGLVGRRKGTGHIQGYPFKGKGPGGGIPGYQADSELAQLRNQYSAARAHRRG